MEGRHTNNRFTGTTGGTGEFVTDVLMDTLTDMLVNMIDRLRIQNLPCSFIDADTDIKKRTE